MVFFRITLRNFSESPGLSIGTFQMVQREVMDFPYVVRKNENSYSVQKFPPLEHFSNHTQHDQTSAKEHFYD